jgi:hypothetical protein
VQLASEAELLSHTATVGCEKVPFQRMLPVVASYDLSAVAWDPGKDTAGSTSTASSDA